jgi:uncharacterized membrane protein
VFAIAVTLLVLELHLPAPGGEMNAQHQFHDLIAIWPQYLVYFVSFATIGIMWLNHHALFANVQRITHGIVLANLLLLAFISFLPFPTEVLARYGITSVAVVYYGLTMTAISIAFNVVYQQVLAAHPQPKKAMTLWSVVGLTVYPLATLVGYFFPLAGVMAYGLLAAFYMQYRNVRAIVIDA